MGQWVEVPLSKELNKNVDGSQLTAEVAAIENAYINSVGGLSRFPQLKTFLTLSQQKPVFLAEDRGDMIAVSGGRFYRVDVANVTGTDITGAALQGNGRPIFDTTEDELVISAGKQPIKLKGAQTEILSPQAPETTHVGWLAGFLIAIEKDSGRFSYADASTLYQTWDPLSILSAESKTDDLIAAVVTEKGELILAGDKTLEQHDPAPNGEQPFYRRFVIPTGVYSKAPYTLLAADGRVWGINSEKEFTAFSSQTGLIESVKVQKRLETVDNWEQAYAIELPIAGERFIVLQMPYATNDYGTEGITFLYDYRKKRWMELYSFDEVSRLPTKWQGWSYLEIQERKFIGGNGVIYEVDSAFTGESTQRMLWRSGHIQLSGGRFSIERVRMRANCGQAAIGAAAPIISMRANRNNRGFGRLCRRNMRLSGHRENQINFGKIGTGHSIQLEFQITDNVPVEISRVDILVERLDD